MNRCAPEDFVCHPVADAGKTFLHEQNRFDRCPRAPLEEFTDCLAVESWREDSRSNLGPPVRWLGPCVKQYPTEHAWVCQHQAVLLGEEHKMIMLFRNVVS